MNDPVGLDGLLEPPQEFRTPAWFIVLIFVAVVVSVIVGLVVLI